jgi:hypothetical protein
MFIKKNGKNLIEINTVIEFQNFILDKKFYKYFIKFRDSDIQKVNDLINQTEFLNYKKIKPVLRSVLNYPESIYNKDFLLSMGWELDMIDIFISEKQSKNSNILKQKKQSNPEKYKSSETTNIEYWLNKGYNLNDAKIKLSERQSTFSLKKCIDKYGEVVGTEKFLNRQKKWINTLKNKENFQEVQLKKNVFKYDVKETKLLLQHANYKEKTKGIIMGCSTYNTINEFIDCIIKNDDIKKYSDLTQYVNSKVICNIFKTTPTIIKNLFYEKINLNQNRQYYGISVYHNGIRYKSVGEYRVALFLEENKINFDYEKNYPNSNLKCDFYLKEKDTYIELYGLLNKKNLNKLDDNQQIYKQKVDFKNQFCIDNNIKLIYDFDYNLLINKIQNYYYEN